MNTELDRFNFLIKRDGLKAALLFEQRILQIYCIAAFECFSNSKTGYKGAAWAKIYKNAAKACASILKSY